MSPAVVVYGATGHTGRFVVSALRRRGHEVIVAGRDAARLGELGGDARAAAVDDPAALDRALAGAAAAINCAGPFAATAAPLIAAALRARIPALDVAAEVEVAAATFAELDGPARDAGVTVVPSVAFYGGLGDLVATAAAGDWAGGLLDEITLAYALSSWHPTAGTRATIRTSTQRRGGRRLVVAGGRLEHRDGPAPVGEHDYPPPFGRQRVVGEFTTADCVTIPSHLRAGALHSVMTAAPLADLAGDGAPAGDEQRFLVEAIVRRGGEERRAVARGRDIYASSAPLVVAAAERVLAGGAPPGVHAAGALLDAPAVLRALQRL